MTVTHCNDLTTFIFHHKKVTRFVSFKVMRYRCKDVYSIPNILTYFTSSKWSNMLLWMSTLVLMSDVKLDVEGHSLKTVGLIQCSSSNNRPGMIRAVISKQTCQISIFINRYLGTSYTKQNCCHPLLH